MKRRAALALLALAAAGPLAHAQPRLKTLGYLSNGADPAWLVKLLAARGHVEGRNFRLEVRTRGWDGLCAQAKRLDGRIPKRLAVAPYAEAARRQLTGA